MKIVSTNPSKNYAVIGEVESTTEQELQDIVTAAHKAQASWAQLALQQRCQAVASFVAIAKRRSDELAQVISDETGRPITGARADVTRGIPFFEGYLATAQEHLSPKVVYENDSETHTVHREPWGVVAAICPWNFPFTNVAWQCGQALIAGNAVIYKNSEENQLFAQLIAEIISESDIPHGVFSVIYGDGEVGEWLARSDINRITFTGSFAVGYELTKIGAEKFIPVMTELGGSGPYIIMPNVTITDALINDLYTRRFNNSGQFCTSLKRLIVHESLFDEIVSKLKTVVESKVIGDPRDEKTDLGPVVAKRQLETIEAQVADAVAQGAKVVTGGKRPLGLQGAYYEPTILTNITRNMRVWHEETFGPVLPVVSFSTELEAIERANDSEFGLSACIATPDDDQFARIAKQLHVGMVARDEVVFSNAYVPFGGYKHSGMGRENGELGFHDATQVKLVSQKK